MLVSLLIIASIIMILLFVRLCEKSTNAECMSSKRLEGKTVIVTGGTAGIGFEIATDLAHRGARVIIACPYEEEGIQAKEQIIKATENREVVFKFLDLASLESTRKFAADILNTETRLDILINNAGVGIPADFETKDGMNFIMQVNYYGTFLLTMLLLPLLKNTGKSNEPSRILLTSSPGHRIGQVDIENSNKTNYWFKLQLYANSKIYLIYFANELTKMLHNSNVVINSINPGFVGTKIYNSFNIFLGTIAAFIIQILFKTPWQGAQTSLHVALDKNAGNVSGAYFKNCAINRAAKRTYCEKTMKAVWDQSVRLVRLTKDELHECFKYLRNFIIVRYVLSFNGL